MVINPSAHRRRGLRLLGSASALAVVSGLVAPGVAAAQAQPAPAGASAVLEELVVTAERRTVSLQQTSIAASALGSEELQKKTVTNIADLQRATPSLSIVDQGFSQSVNVRGIGLAVVSPAVDPGVATYRDGVFLPTQTTYGEPFFDIQNVEVLRGPQGTFVGQNSTGGAVFITSKSPTLADRVSGEISAAYGAYNDAKLQGAVNLPISSTLAMRIAFNDEHRDSFYKDIGSTQGEHPGKLDTTNIRLGLLWKPTDALSILFKTQYNTSATDGYAYKPIPGTAFAAFAPKDPFTLNYDQQGLRNDETYVRSSLQVDYEFAGGVKFRSNTGVQYNQQNVLYDIDGSPLPVVTQTQDYVERITTQDVSLISPDNAALRWVIGATYFKYTDHISSLVTAPGSTVNIRIDLPKSSYGVFGSATYNLTPTLELQAGARYSADEVTFGGFTKITPGPLLPTAAKGDDDQWTGKVTLNWKPNADNLVYGFWTKGFKSGGVNTDGSDFAPETVFDYELGWKSTLLAGHLRTQLGAFYTDYRNFQAVTFAPATAGSDVTNASKSAIKGVEAQAQLQMGGFGADASLSYVNSRIGSLRLVDTRALPGGTATGLGVQCAPGVPSHPPVCFDYGPYLVSLNGRSNPYSPEWTANIGLQYDFALKSGTLTPRIDVSYAANQWATFFEAPADRLAARTLVNLQLTWRRDDWTVQAYGTNVFDKTYVAGFAGLFGNNQFYGAPRQFGLRVARDF